MREHPEAFSGTARWAVFALALWATTYHLRNQKKMQSFGLHFLFASARACLAGGLERNLLQTDCIFDIMQSENEAKECLIK